MTAHVSVDVYDLSIPSPDSTLFERRANAGAVKNFQFLLRIPPSRMSGTSLRSSISFNSFSGFHHRIPHKAAAEGAMGVKDFQFLLRIPLPTASSFSQTKQYLPFNSFSGFHWPDINDGAYRVEVSFQFLLRIPRR